MARHKALFTHNEILPDISLARNSHTKLSRIKFWRKWIRHPFSPKFYSVTNNFGENIGGNFRLKCKRNVKCEHHHMLLRDRFFG